MLLWKYCDKEKMKKGGDALACSKLTPNPKI